MATKTALKLGVTISKQGKRFVAYSPALDISTTGKSEKDAQKKFEELIAIFLEEITSAGTLESVLTDLGWEKVQNEFRPPVVSQQTINIPVPTFA